MGPSLVAAIWRISAARIRASKELLARTSGIRTNAIALQELAGGIVRRVSVMSRGLEGEREGFR